MKKPEEATAEELLADLTRYEDLDAALIVTRTEEGGVFVMPYDDGNISGEGPTFKDALIAFGRASYERWWNDWMEIDWSPQE